MSFMFPAQYPGSTIIPDDDKDAFHELYPDYMYHENKLDNLIAPYQGMLYKISRTFIDTIEKMIEEQHKPYLEKTTKERIQFVKECLKKGKYASFNNEQPLDI